MSGLAARRCVRMKKGSPPLAPDAAERLRAEVPQWAIREGKRLEREFRFKDFKEALAFTVRAGEVADAEDHHPDIHLSWGRVRIEVWTHSVGGLSENDFILAAKIDALGSSSF